MEGDTGFVVPGDRLDTALERPDAKGIVREGDVSYATVMGTTRGEGGAFSPLRPMGELRTGDIVYGEVMNCTNSLAQVRLDHVEGLRRGPWHGVYGALHVSKVTDSFQSNIRDHYRIGDLVRARVAQASPSIQLSTVGEDLGVVKGLCSRCRSQMRRKGALLYCGRCDEREARKIATDYGHMDVASLAHDHHNPEGMGSVR